jgi:hypothetical protein
VGPQVKSAVDYYMVSTSHDSQGMGLEDTDKVWALLQPLTLKNHTYLLRPNCSTQIREDGGTTSFYITHLGIQGTELGPSIQGS